MHNGNSNTALVFYYIALVDVLMTTPAEMRQAMHLGIARNLTAFTAENEATTTQLNLEETHTEKSAMHSDSVEGVGLILCEYGKMTIVCPDPHANVAIVYAEYGRLVPGDVLCPNPSILTTNCSAPDTTQTTAKICEGKNMCEIFASNSVYGDPCVGTYKYMRIHFICTSAVATSIGGYKPTTYLT